MLAASMAMLIRLTPADTEESEGISDDKLLVAVVERVVEIPVSPRTVAIDIEKKNLG